MLRAYDRDTNSDSDYCKLAKANRVQYELLGTPAMAREGVGESLELIDARILQRG
jgi:hypothetical protein